MDPTVIARIVLLLVPLLIVLAGVGGLGFALGRLIARRQERHPTLPDDPGRRLRLLEEELGQLQSDLARIQEEREFERRLRRGEDSDRPLGSRDAA